MSKSEIPNFPFRVLRWFCPTQIAESIEGDLEEEFTADVKSSGRKVAIYRLYINVFRFFRPGIVLRNHFTYNFISTIMLRSYVTIALRYLSKNRSFSIINVMGLALGMCAIMLIYDYVSFESSYDRFHRDYEKIFRVTTTWNKNAADSRATTMPWSGPSVKEAFAEVEDFARFTKLEVFTGYSSVQYKDVLVNQQEIFLVDPQFLKLFNFKLLHGDMATALAQPTNIVITASVAKKFFKDDDPLGKLMHLDTHKNLSESEFVVSAIIEDPPKKSHFSFDFLLPFSLIYSGLHNGSTYWHWDYTYCYLKLREGANVAELEEKMGKLRMQQHGHEMQYYNDVVDFNLQPVTDIHLKSALKGEMSVNNDGRFLDLLLIIGICIIVCAYINYINLTTVKSIERRIEVGVRRVVGSSRWQLTQQLLVESLIMNVFAFTMAIALYFLCIPVFQNTFNIHLDEPVFFSVRKLMTVILPVLIAGSIASVVYPAFVLTSFRPALVLKGVTAVGRSKSSFQRFRLLAQFIFCIIFISGTYGLYQQLHFMKNHDLGMRMNEVLVIKGYGFQEYKVFEDFKLQAERVAQVDRVGISSVAPGDEVFNLGLRPIVSRASEKTKSVEAKMAFIDDSFFETIQAQVVAGRNFRKENGDKHSVIINEEAARLLGFEDASSAIGEKLAGLEQLDVDIIGVIKNYHQRSLKNQMEPMVYLPMWEVDYGWNSRYYFVRLQNGHQQADQLAELKNIWTKVAPDKPFEYFYLNQYFEKQYQADEANTSIFVFFAFFAIGISCLGLFGLVAYTTLQRTKEIGVRKVLGASVNSILLLLSKDFIVLLFTSSLVAVPLVAMMLSKWLQQYAFKIEVGYVVLGVPVMIVCVLALLTIALKSFRVASANPVDSLRYE